MVILKYIGFILLFATYIDSANILLIIPFPAISHYIAVSTIGLELARRGHNVTVITTRKEIDLPPNYTQIIVDDIEDVSEKDDNEKPSMFSVADMSAHDFQHKILQLGLIFTEVTFNSESVKDFLKKDNTFDLVIAEQFNQEALNVLALKYNAPLALVTTFGNCMRHNILTGNPLQLATVLLEHLAVQTPLSFLGRLKNLYFTIFEYVTWRFLYLPKQEALVQKYLPELIGARPSLYDIQKNVSLMLINGHFSYETPVALLPNIIEIGGIHLTEKKGTLIKDLQKILDDSEHGVVYVNLGSNLKSSQLPLEKKNALLNVFKQLNQTVLWKYEKDILEGKPNNVIIRKWMPQNEILSHPNVKVFISHGGLLGTHEAIYNGVPLLGIPIYGDQFNNLLLIEQAVAGKILKFHDMNEENLQKLLHDILNNDIYMKSAKELSQRFKDRPMNSLDTAIFWLEYVIRHKGASFMKNPARNLSWITYNMLDIYAFITIAITVCIVIVIKVILGLKRMLGLKIKEKLI